MSTKHTTVKPWGGRFTQATDSSVENFTESVSFDYRLYPHDITGSIAHTRMLVRIKVLNEEEGESIINGLSAILTDIEAGNFDWKQELEDVHMNIESALVERIGEPGKKLHTGRSRNDQVATDLRLYLRDEVDSIRYQLKTLMSSLCDLADQESDTIMPGFTHLQIAQPVTFGHHMMAWFEMLKRDDQRLTDCRKRINLSPLGASALAGTSYPLDREYTAELLGFDGVAENSLDAVSDRDFIIEFCAVASISMMHLSRFSEELILWMNPLFGFIDLDDAYCTGSSIMPQKKNPDVPELVRGKTARVYGDLMAMLTLMKAQPLAYNRDNQEDKLALFDAVDTLHACLQAYSGIVPAISVKREAMLNAAKQGYATATDLADYLVRAGVAFRDAHAAVGQSVQYAISQKKDLAELTLEELGRFCPNVKEDVYSFLELNGSINARDYIGGTAPSQVKQAIKAGRDYLGNFKS
ncbi:MAG: argininosuccinate lyase [Gammaproteobacteria bacterium]|jgi:argininosuccinate lyase